MFLLYFLCFRFSAGNKHELDDSLLEPSQHPQLNNEGKGEGGRGEEGEVGARDRETARERGRGGEGDGEEGGRGGEEEKEEKI